MVNVAQTGSFSSTLASMEISRMVHIVKNASSMDTAHGVFDIAAIQTMATYEKEQPRKKAHGEH